MRNRFRFLDVNVTSLEGLSSKQSPINSLFKPRFYAVVSVTTPATLIATNSLATSLADPLDNKTHEWKNSPPLRFNAEVSKFHDDCAMLVIQLRKKRPFHADKDVGEPLIAPVLELFESAENNKAGLSNAAVYGVAVDNKVSGKKKKKKQQGYLYFSYRFSNSLVVRDVGVNGDSGGDKGVAAAAWQSDSKILRRFKDTNERYYPLGDINETAYQLLLFRESTLVH